MKRQTDLTAKDLSNAAIRQFRLLAEQLGRTNVSGGEWYVRIDVTPTGTPRLLLVIPITVRVDVGSYTAGEHEYITVVA